MCDRSYANKIKCETTNCRCTVWVKRHRPQLNADHIQKHTWLKRCCEHYGITSIYSHSMSAEHWAYCSAGDTQSGRFLSAFFINRYQSDDVRWTLTLNAAEKVCRSQKPIHSLGVHWDESENADRHRTEHHHKNSIWTIYIIWVYRVLCVILMI